jgi:hypothetical protein
MEVFDTTEPTSAFVAANLQIFAFEEHPVRTVSGWDGEPWFVGPDVCRALTIGNLRDALSRLDDDEKDGVGIADAIGRLQQTTIISEPGLYRLIFTSRVEAAERFKRWLAHDVLPTLHKTGRYELPETGDEPDPLIVDDNVTLAGMSLDRINSGRELVRLSLRLFGRDHAVKLWQKIELPGHDFIPMRQAPATMAPDWGDVLRHLLDTPLRGSELTIGAARTNGAADQHLTRRLWGMGVKPMGHFVIVSVADSSWKERFAQSPWSHNWRQVMKSIPGVGDPRKAQFGNFAARAVTVPMARIVEAIT